MTDTSDMRRDFEAFVTDRYGFEGSDFSREADSDTYLFFTLENEWEFWQAATERAIAVERERCAVVCQTMKTVSGTDDVKRGWNAALRVFAAAIRQGGDT